MTRVTKVEGQADEGMVLLGQAAENGRRRVHERVFGARRHLSGVCGVWFPRVRDLHRFFIVVARATVNDDGLGGTALDPRVWSVALLPTRRRVREGVRNCAMLPGPRCVVFRWR